MATLNVNNDMLTIFNDTYNFVINTKSKHFQHLKPSIPNDSEPKNTHENYLGLLRYCSALSNNGDLYAVVDDRNLIIWSTSSWTQKCVKTLERSASKIIFTPSDQSVVVADKTGDVYLFSILEENPKGTLLLGHLSILLDVLVTADEMHIITCDRDEKIRVSHFPNAYNIECFCLGHTEFVTRVLILNDSLVSCSGDGTIKFWSFLAKKELLSYSVSEDVDKSNDTELDYCIITNISASDPVICVSVHKHDAILVYQYTQEPSLTMKLTQTVSCIEPFDFALSNGVLWVLSSSSTSVLDALHWDGTRFVTDTPNDVKTIVKIVNEQCSSLKDCTYIDLSILYKKFQLKEEKVKRIKMEGSIS